MSVKTIKKILAEDAEAFLKYRKQIAVETTNTLQYEGMKLPTSEEIAKKILAQAEDKSSLNLGVFIENEIIAALNFRKVMPDHPWCQHIASFGMGVLKAYWGQGLGTQLLLSQEEHALKNGVTRIEAYVRLVNERGINLYTKNGYLIEGKRKNAAIINGEYHDEYFIAKILTSHD